MFDKNRGGRLPESITLIYFDLIIVARAVYIMSLNNNFSLVSRYRQ